MNEIAIDSDLASEPTVKELQAQLWQRSQHAAAGPTESTIGATAASTGAAAAATGQYLPDPLRPSSPTGASDEW